VATRAQLERLAQRIEALGRSEDDGPRVGVVWRNRGETDDEARRRHAMRYPEDDVDDMLVVGLEPPSQEELIEHQKQWIERYVR
jgi:hypothetical protein